MWTRRWRRAISRGRDWFQPTVFYRWQKQLFEQGTMVFRRPSDTETKKLRRQVERLEDQLGKKNEVLGELMEEYAALRKELGVL